MGWPYRRYLELILQLLVGMFRPHFLRVDVARSVVCVSECVGHTGELCKKAEPIEMPFGGGADSCGSKEPYILDGIQTLKGRGTFERDICPPMHCNVPAHECIVHCSSAAAGECSCPAHMADECIRRREGDKMVMRPFATLLRTLALGFVLLTYIVLYSL